MHQRDGGFFYRGRQIPQHSPNFQDTGKLWPQRCKTNQKRAVRAESCCGRETCKERVSWFFFLMFTAWFLERITARKERVPFVVTHNSMQLIMLCAGCSILFLQHPNQTSPQIWRWLWCKITQDTEHLSSAGWSVNFYYYYILKGFKWGWIGGTQSHILTYSSTESRLRFQRPANIWTADYHSFLTIVALLNGFDSSLMASIHL